MKRSLKITLLGLLLSITLPVLGDGGGADKLTISVYTGMGSKIDLGGIEITRKNLSFNMGCGGYTIDSTDSTDSTSCHKQNGAIGGSLGIKIYDSEEDSKHKFFGGVDLIKNYSYSSTNSVTNNSKSSNEIALIGGYKYTANSGIYLSPYIGIQKIVFASYNCNEISQFSPCLGLNIGYQFKPIQRK